MKNFNRKRKFGYATIFTVVALFLSGQVSVAQEEEESRFANAKTTKVRAMSAATAKKVEPVRELLAPEVPEGEVAPEPDAAGALRALNRIRTDDFPSHEKAEIWNLYGYVYFLLDDQNRAREYYTRVVEEPEANAPLRNRTLKTVSQLYMIEEDWVTALRYFQEWMSLQQILGPDDYALLSTIYYNMEDQDNSLKNIEIAIDLRESKDQIGKENWYSIQRAIYYERNNYRKVVSILEKLIVNYPNVRYWRELSGMYAELEQPRDQMNAFAVSYVQNGLATESQVVGLAYMYIGADVPYKGAEILVKGMETGVVSRNEKNLQLVGSAYYQARELNKALPYMEQAAQKATSGEPFGRLAGIYLDMERYEDSIRTGREAIRRGGVRQTHLVRLGLGTALFNKKDYDEALKVMREIDSEGPGGKSAEQWIKYIGSEKRRDQQLRDSGIDLDKILAASN